MTLKRPHMYSRQEINKVLDDLHEFSLQADDPTTKAIYARLTNLATSLQLQIDELQNQIDDLESRFTIEISSKKDT